MWIYLKTVLNFSIPRVGGPHLLCLSGSHPGEMYFNGSTTISSVSSAMVLKELTFQNEYSAVRQKEWDSASYDHLSINTSHGNSLCLVKLKLNP